MDHTFDGMRDRFQPHETGTTRRQMLRTQQQLCCPTPMLAGILLASVAPVQADGDPVAGGSALVELAEKEKAEKKESPWLLVPILSSNPKLGTSVGVVGGYLYYFDPESRVSQFIANAQYTSTNSVIGILRAQMSFAADHQRLNVLVAGGNIKNDYDDFLGTGMPLKTEDQLRAVAARYLYRIWGDWFVGVQGLYTTYQILGQSELDNEILETLGLTGFSGGGVGAAASFDSRDNEFSPSKGWLVNINNIAYREWIAGDNNYEVYRADVRYYLGQSHGNVLAFRLNNQWTVDAPKAAYASITLRGYKFGQYLGQNMATFEAEQRLRIAARWTGTVFVGVGCLYGGTLTCTDGENVYPTAGAGIQYVIREKEGMVLNLEYAKGKGDNAGIYLRLGYGF